MRIIEKAEKFFIQGLEIYKYLGEKDPYEFLHYVARSQNDLGLLYKKLRRNELAKKSFKAAEEWFGNRIIPTVASSTHAGLEVMRDTETVPGVATVLRT